MKLYLLTRDDDDIDYDEAAGYVVAAGNEHQARNLIRIAKEERGGGDEGPAPWLDAGQSTCLELGTARQGTAPGIILRDFRAG